MFLLTLMISLNLGTPSVTFFAEIPAKWKVFRVIYVAGSPKLYAAIAPTISPGETTDCSNFDFISARSHSRAGAVNFSFRITFFEQSK